MECAVRRLPGYDQWEILNENGMPLVFPLKLEEAIRLIKEAGFEVELTQLESS